MIAVLLVLVSGGLWAKPVDWPSGCWQQKKFPCAVTEQKKESFLQVDKVVYHFKRATSVQFQSAKEFRLLAGDLLLEAKEPILVNQQQLQLSINGWALLRTDKKMNQIQIENWLGQVALDKQELPVGFANWFSAGVDGKAMGMMVPLEKLKTFQTLNSFSSVGEPAALIAQMNEAWASRIEQASQFYATSANRSVASLEEQKYQKRQALARQRQEKETLRQSFKNKFYNGQQDLD